jgi:transcriptional regulator with XRE-family HTH domain
MKVTPGERLRRLREDRGLSQSELGRRVKMPQYRISRLETGSVPILAEEIEVFAKALGIQAGQFFDKAAA